MAYNTNPNRGNSKAYDAWIDKNVSPDGKFSNPPGSNAPEKYNDFSGLSGSQLGGLAGHGQFSWDQTGARAEMRNRDIMRNPAFQTQPQIDVYSDQTGMMGLESSLGEPSIYDPLKFAQSLRQEHGFTDPNREHNTELAIAGMGPQDAEYQGIGRVKSGVSYVPQRRLLDEDLRLMGSQDPAEAAAKERLFALRGAGVAPASSGSFSDLPKQHMDRLVNDVMVKAIGRTQRSDPDKPSSWTASLYPDPNTAGFRKGLDVAQMLGTKPATGPRLNAGYGIDPRSQSGDRAAGTYSRDTGRLGIAPGYEQVYGHEAAHQYLNAPGTYEEKLSGFDPETMAPVLDNIMQYNAQFNKRGGKPNLPGSYGTMMAALGKGGKGQRGGVLSEEAAFNAIIKLMEQEGVIDPMRGVG